MFGASKKSPKVKKAPIVYKGSAAVPKVSSTLMTGLREHLVLLNTKGVGSAQEPITAESEQEKQSKHGYLALANTVLQQCSVSQTSFDSACVFRPGGDADREKLTKLFAAMASLRRVEGSIAEEKKAALVPELKKALNEVVTLSDGEPMTNGQKQKVTQLLQMDPFAEKEGFLIFSMTLVSDRIRQLYHKNLSEGNIVPIDAKEKRSVPAAKQAGVYAFQYNLDTLHEMLKDVSVGFEVKHPPAKIEPSNEQDKDQTETIEPVPSESNTAEDVEVKAVDYVNAKQHAAEDFYADNSVAQNAVKALSATDIDNEQRQRIKTRFNTLMSGLNRADTRQLQSSLSRYAMNEEGTGQVQALIGEEDAVYDAWVVEVIKELEIRVDALHAQYVTYCGTSKKRVLVPQYAYLIRQFGNAIVNDSEFHVSNNEISVALAKMAENDPENTALLEGCRCYIQTRNFEPGANPPDEWYLAPFAEDVMELLGDQMTMIRGERSEGVFITNVDKINSRVRDAFRTISYVMAGRAEQQAYLSNSEISEKIQEKIRAAISVDAGVIKAENEDVQAADGSLSEGNTTRKIRENLDILTQNMDQKMEQCLTAAENHLPQLELCRESMKASPELLPILFDETTADGEDFYYKAKTFLKQADRNIDELAKAVDADPEVVGDMAFLKRLIEGYGGNLFSKSERAIRSTVRGKLADLKKQYESQASGKKLLSQKVVEKFGENNYFQQEMRRRIAKLPAQSVTEEEEDRQIQALWENQQRNEKTLSSLKNKWMGFSIRAADRPYYRDELLRVMQRFLPLDDEAFQAGLQKSMALVRAKDVQTLRPEQVKPVDKTSKKSEQELAKLAQQEEAKRQKRQFQRKHKAAITAMAGDYQENLLYGFDYTALRINNQNVEVTSQRDQRMRAASARKGDFEKNKKGAPGKDETDRRSEVEKHGAPVSIIEFVSYFQAAQNALRMQKSTKGNCNERTFQALTRAIHGENHTLQQYVADIHQQDQAKGNESDGKSRLYKMAFGLVPNTDKLEKTVSDDYADYLKAVGAGDLVNGERDYYYYGTGDYRIQIQQVMGDDFGRLHRSEFEKKLLEIEIYTGMEIGNEIHMTLDAAQEQGAKDSKNAAFFDSRFATKLFRDHVVRERNNSNEASERAKARTDRQGSSNIVDRLDTMKLLRSGDTQLLDLSRTLESRIEDILAYSNGDLKLLIPHMLDDDGLYQTLLGTDSDYDTFVLIRLPIICQRMRRLQATLSKERVYFISMMLKMKPEHPPEGIDTVSDLILSPPSTDEEQTLADIERYGNALYRQKVGKAGVSDDKGKSAFDRYSEIVNDLGKQSLNRKMDAAENVARQRMLIAGQVDEKLLNKKAETQYSKSQLKQVELNKNAVIACPNYRMKLKQYEEAENVLSAESEKAEAEFDAFQKEYKKKPAAEQMALEAGRTIKENRYRKTHDRWVQAQSAPQIFEKLIMSFFAKDMLQMTPEQFQTGLESRVDAFLEAQEQAKQEGVASQNRDRHRRELSSQLRTEILEGERVLEQQRNKADILHHLGDRRVSAANQLQLTARIEDNYSENLKKAENERSQSKTRAHAQYGNTDQISSAGEAMRKADREQQMRGSVEGVTHDFLKKHDPGEEAQHLTAMKRHISKQVGGGSPAVQNVVAEFMFEKDTDAAATQSERQYAEVETRAANDELIERISHRATQISAGREPEVQEDNSHLAVAQAKGNYLTRIDDNLQEVATLDKDKEDAQKEEKKQEKEERKTEKKAVKAADSSEKTLHPIVAAVGEIHRLLTVCFEALEISRTRVEWALSTIVMRYGDNLLRLKDEALVRAVYSLTAEFKEKLENLSWFTNLDQLAAANDDTLAEYHDRAHLLSIQLGSMDQAEFRVTCEQSVRDFSLYCESIALSERLVEQYAEQYAQEGEEITDDQKKKAVRSLVKILRGRIAKETITDSPSLEHTVTEQLSDKTAFRLLTQSGYTVDSADHNSISTDQASLYRTTDRQAFENFLRHGDEKALAYYKSLSPRDRAVFLAVLGNRMIGPHLAESGAASSQVIQKFAVKRHSETMCGQVVLDYANGEEVAFTPRDYTYAIDVLVGSTFFTDAKVNMKIFRAVIRTLEGLRAARRVHKEVNSDVLDFSHETVIEQVRRAAGGEDPLGMTDLMDTAKTLTDEDGFIDYLRKLYDQTQQQANGKKEAAALTDMKQLLALATDEDPNEHNWFLVMVGILQKRSMVDTDKRAGGFIDQIKELVDDYSILEKHYANEAGRDDFIETYSALDDNAIVELVDDPGTWKQAAMTLISYQVSTYHERDDASQIDVEADIVGANRRISLDNEMLKRAFTLLKKVKEQNRRNKVIDMASTNVTVDQAIPLYNSYREKPDDEVTASTFDELVQTQRDTDAKSDANITWVTRGYQLLPKTDKDLFLVTLSDRTMLDLTKESIGLERIGWTGDARQHLNASGRIELMEEYVRRGKVEAAGDVNKKALLSLFTSQVNDIKSDVGAIKSSTRSTAVDWKLFGRALEFVHLCQTARRNFLERRELERALMGGGESPMEYSEELDLYGKNERKSGNRFTRIAGRTAKDVGLGLVPDEVRDAVVRIGYAVSRDPETANRFFDSGIASEGMQEKVEGHREKRQQLGQDPGGARLTAQTIEENFSEGQKGILNKITEAMGGTIREQVEETFSAENMGSTTADAIEQVGNIVHQFEATDIQKTIAAGQGSGNILARAQAMYQSHTGQVAAFDEEREKIKELAEQSNVKVDNLMSENIAAIAERAEDVVGSIQDSADLYNLNKVDKQAAVTNGKVDGAITQSATEVGADAKLAISGKENAYRGAHSATRLAKSQKVQSIVEQAISIVSSFAEVSEAIDPTQLLAKLVEGGFTALTAAINGIINYCASRSNVYDFIRLGDFDQQLTDLAQTDPGGAFQEELPAILAMKDKDKKNVWMRMHGMDMVSAIDYVGKETVYALKFCVSKSCRLPYLRSMATLVLSVLGFTVADGKVIADDSEIFDKLMGSR